MARHHGGVQVARANDAAESGEIQLDAEVKKIREAKGVDTGTAPNTKQKTATAPTLDKGLAPAIATKAHLDAAMGEMETAHRAKLNATVGQIALRISDEGDQLYRQCGKVTDKKGRPVRINSFDKFAEHVIRRQLGIELADLKKWMTAARGSVEVPAPVVSNDAKPVPNAADLHAALIEIDVCRHGLSPLIGEEPTEAFHTFKKRLANLFFWIDRREVWKARVDVDGKQAYESFAHFVDAEELVWILGKALGQEFSRRGRPKAFDWSSVDVAEAEKREVGRTSGYPVIPAHPAAEVFPMLGEDELNELANDLKENGQEEPIILMAGQILDGRNRYRACEIAGLKPRFKEYAGKDRDEDEEWDPEEDPDTTQADAVSFVLSKNIHRRHLDTSQRSMLAVRLMKLQKLTQEEAAKQAAISRSNLVRAKQIDTKGSAKIVAAVEARQIKVGDAAEIVDLPHDVQDELLEMVRAKAADTLWEARQKREHSVREEAASTTPEARAEMLRAGHAKRLEQAKKDREEHERRQREKEAESAAQKPEPPPRYAQFQFSLDLDGVKPVVDHDDGTDRYRLYACNKDWGGIEVVSFQDGGQRFIAHGAESFEERREWLESRIAGTTNESE